MLTDSLCGFQANSVPPDTFFGELVHSAGRQVPTMTRMTPEFAGFLAHKRAGVNLSTGVSDN
jgi:hypothetical protein